MGTNDGLVNEPVLDEPIDGLEEPSAPAQPIKVEESEQYKQSQTELARERQERQRLEEQLRVAQAPPPQPKQPDTDPWDDLDDKLIKAEADFHTANTWCELNDETHPQYRRVAAERDKLRSEAKALRKDQRKMGARFHVDAVKEVANQQTEYQRAAQGLREQIANHPDTKDLAQAAQEHVHYLMMTGVPAVNAIKAVRDLVGPSGGSGTQMGLHSIQGGKSGTGYIQTEGAGGADSGKSTIEEEKAEAKAADNILESWFGETSRKRLARHRQ